LLLSKQNKPKKKKQKNRKTQRECTLRGLHRENEERERHTQAQNEREVKEMRAPEAVELENSRASFIKNKCGE